MKYFYTHCYNECDTDKKPGKGLLLTDYDAENNEWVPYVDMVLELCPDCVHDLVVWYIRKKGEKNEKYTL